jgi:hypothetical protein
MNLFQLFLHSILVCFPFQLRAQFYELCIIVGDIMPPYTKFNNTIRFDQYGINCNIEHRYHDTLFGH